MRREIGFEEFTPDITVEDKNEYDEDEDDHISAEELFYIPMAKPSPWSYRGSSKKLLGCSRRSHDSHCETRGIKLIEAPADIRTRKKHHL